ncbi:PAS domain S-box protein [Cupriavidus pauculus]|uniref:LuxR family transcriptional regulator n=1 Tax=Cupriavidus pauculus TaxID=82633 RepID=A0A2N5CB21_9BURK|nr:PAS domain S-box protein [Cupriavidus pauculus]PLP99419.1 LuxR family transcriptional regulator [Cupriavidus pauculus]
MMILKETGAIALADSLPDTVFLVDLTGRIRYVNTACEDVLGFSQRDLIGQLVLDLVVPDDRNRTRQEAERVLAGSKRRGFENRYRKRDGSDAHLSWSAQWHPAHELRIGVARDVTTLRQMPTHRRESSDHVRRVEALAPHERRVLNLLLTEAAEKQIAERLGLAASTTHSYITSIYRKLGVRGRAGLMSLWLHQMWQE